MKVAAAGTTRRDLLRWSGFGALTVVVGGSGALAYRTTDQQILDPSRGSAFDPWRNWRSIPGLPGMVAAAVLAASPHNMQPWWFRIGAADIEVHTDPARAMPHVDPYGRERLIGLGCALENLTLAAAARGFAPMIRYRPAGGDPTLAARVSLAAAPAREDDLYAAVGDRHSNRAPYRDEPVREGWLAALGDLVDDGAVTLTWVTAAAPRKALGDLMVAAAQAIVEDEPMSRDGFAWFRGSAAQIAAHRDGLTLDGQGLSPLMTSAAKLLPPTSRHAGDRFWVTQTREVHTATAAAYGLLLVADPHDPETQLRGGRMLQRLHLAATVRGLAMQHMNQITERIDRDLSLGRAPAFAPGLAEAAGRPGRQVLAAFRLGHPTTAGRATPRRAVSQVTR